MCRGQRSAVSHQIWNPMTTLEKRAASVRERLVEKFQWEAWPVDLDNWLVEEIREAVAEEREKWLALMAEYQAAYSRLTVTNADMKWGQRHAGKIVRARGKEQQ